MSQSMTLPLMQKHNDPISIFAREDSKKGKGATMATKTKKQTTTEQTTPETTAQQNEHQPEQSVKQAPAQKVNAQQQERDALKAAGLKKCPQHMHLLDRLPDAVKQPIDGQSDPSIRPLAEYQRNTSVCRACDHVIQRDWRMTHKASGGTTPTTTAKQEALLAKLIAQESALSARISALQASIAAARTEKAATEERAS